MDTTKKMRRKENQVLRFHHTGNEKGCHQDHVLGPIRGVGSHEEKALMNNGNDMETI